MLWLIANIYIHIHGCIGQAVHKKTLPLSAFPIINMIFVPRIRNPQTGEECIRQEEKCDFLVKDFRANLWPVSLDEEWRRKAVRERVGCPLDSNFVIDR